MRLFVPLIAVVLVFVTSCGDATVVDVSTTSASSSTGSPTTVTTRPTTTQTHDATATSSAATTTTTSVLGGPIDFGPQNGDVLAVVGVSHDDQLNLRLAPGPNQQILAMIDPTYANLVAQGATWDTSKAFWIKADYEGLEGWVHFGFVAYMGYTDDATATVVAELGDYPVAATMKELGLVVAEVFRSTDPPSRIVMTVEPTGGDFGEVTYDVIGLGDDAEYGVRLNVFGEATTEGFVLKTVELTSLCGRGVSDTGLCI